MEQRQTAVLRKTFFGDANALVKKSLYFELGGFEDAPGVAWHDWAFYAKAVLRGFNLQVAPLPLLWYRVSETSMNRTSSEWRSAQSIIREYEDALPSSLKQFPSLLYGLVKQPVATAIATPITSSFVESTEVVLPANTISSTVISAEERRSNLTQNTHSNSQANASADLAAKAPNISAPPASTAGVSSTAVASDSPRGLRSDQSVTQFTATDVTPQSLRERLVSNKALLYTWWFLSWQLPLRLHERQATARQFETRVKTTGDV